MTTRYFIVDPNGKRHTRTTKNRTYTHAVIARRNLDVALERARWPGWDELDRSNHAFYVREANPATRRFGPYSDEKLAEYVRYAAMTADEYVADQLKQRLDQVTQDVEDGDFDVYRVVGWNGRLDLAQKLAANPGKHLKDVQIVEAQVA